MKKVLRVLGNFALAIMAFIPAWRLAMWMAPLNKDRAVASTLGYMVVFAVFYYLFSAVIRRVAKEIGK